MDQLGSFQILSTLGVGGMGAVYLATDADGQPVALKVRSGGDDELRALFRDEARLGSLLRHPNLVRAIAHGDDGDTSYLAMEYVHGVDLVQLGSELRFAGRALPYSLAVAIVRAAAAGLDHAHRACDEHGEPLQLVHRDVSLSNIMVDYSGSVKVIDFGIAQASGGSHRTNPGVVCGKASYMAPEQCVGDAVDARTDVFSLGVVLYELATGHRCFAGESAFECMVAIVRGEFVAPRTHCPAMPIALEQIICTALSHDPARRFASAADLVAALTALTPRDMTAELAELMADLFTGDGALEHAPEAATSRQLPSHLCDLRDTCDTRIFVAA